MEKSIVVQKTASYFIQEVESPKSLLFVIHGYAQQADEFLKEFESLKKEGILVIAPEALSRFYNKEGKAVANWMTSRNRLNEISDYKLYLNLVLQEIRIEYPDLPLSVLGFSQGVSTAFRWMTTIKDEVHFHACSGSIPPELEKGDFNPSLLKGHFYYGTKDRLFSEEKAMDNIEKLKELKLDFLIHKYEGKHEIPEICMEQLRNS